VVNIVNHDTGKGGCLKAQKGEGPMEDVFNCAWIECEEKWEGRFEMMPNAWGWPSRSNINFMVKQGLITKGIDSPYLCPSHTRKLAELQGDTTLLQALSKQKK
jgi:hypothetical protein